MVIDWLLDLLNDAVTKLFSLIASAVPSPPAWLSDGANMISTVVQYAGEFDSWVPMSIAGPIVVIVPVCLVAGLIIKVARIVLSFFTLGGGSAA